MLRTLTELHGYRIEASDGVVGKLVGAFFDDDRWTIRYLVVDTGTWLHPSEVLLSPRIVVGRDAQARRFAARLTRAEVEHSPPIDVHKPVSRQHPRQSRDSADWPAYWEGRGLYGRSFDPAAPRAAPREAADAAAGDPHLRSTREMVGYQLHTLDATLGHVEDFVIDDQTWAIRYLAVATSNWLPGHHVLIAPQWIGEVSWPARLVDLKVSRDVIKHSPRWTKGEPITQTYEDDLLDYYTRRAAWSVNPRSTDTEPLVPRPPQS